MRFFRLFGIRRRERTTEEEEQEIDAIKEIETEVKRLEKQWEGKEKDFKLFNFTPSILQRLYRLDSDIWRLERPVIIHAPNKHFKQLWKRRIEIDKKIMALERRIKIKKAVERSGLTEKYIKQLKKIERIIQYETENVITALEREIDDFVSAIEDCKSLEKKYIFGIFYRKKLKEITDLEVERGFDQVVRYMRLLRDDAIRSYGYDFEKRMEFFNYLKRESEHLRSEAIA